MTNSELTLRRKRIGLAAAAVAGALGVSHAQAASAIWNTTATNGNWETVVGENNWSTGDGTFPGSLTAVSTDVATFSNNSNFSEIVLGSPLYIGSIGFSGNTLTTNYAIGSTTGAPLIVASNASQGATTNQIFVSGSLRAAPTASITATINAPVSISAQTGLTTGFYVFQNNSLGLGSGDVLVFNGAVSGATGNTATTLTLRGNNVNVNNAVNGAISDGAGAGALSLAKNDNGTWLLNGVNTYTGTTTIGGGALTFARPTALYNGDTSKWTASVITVTNGGTLGLRVGGAGEFAASDVTTLLANFNATSTNTSGLASGASLGFDTTNAAGGAFVYGNTITNTAAGTTIGVRKLGANTLVLAAANTYTGATTVSAGTLRVDGTGTLGTGPVVNNSAVQFNGSTTNTVTNMSGTGSISVTGTAPVLFSSNFNTTYAGGATVGPGSTLGVLGFGRVATQASSTTAAASNTLTVASVAGIAVGSFVTGTGIAAGTTVAAIDSTTLTITLSAPATAGGTANLIYTPVGSTLGGAPVTLTTTNGSNAATVTSAAGLAVGYNVVSPNFTGTITAINGTTVTLSGNATATGATTSTIGNSNAAGLGTLLVDGGTVRYTGPGQASSRTVLFGNSSSIEASGTGGLTFSDAPVAFATPDVARTITLTGTYGAGGAGGIANNINGVIADNGAGAVSVVKAGTGTWRLGGASTYTGGTTLNSGGLEYTGFVNNVLGTGPLTINGGFIAARGNNATLTNNVTVGADFQVGYDDVGVARNTTLSGTVDLGGAPRVVTVTNFNGDAPFDLNLAGVVANGGITKAGTGTLQLSAANTYAGPTTLNAGVTLLNNQNAVQASTVTLNGGGLGFIGSAYNLGGLAASGSGAGFDVALANTTGGPVAVTAGGNGANTAYAGVLSGAGSLTKTGTGTLTLSGANSYTGTTTVQAGTLTLGINAQAPVLTGAGGADVQGGRLVLDYTGGSSPVASVKSILDAGFAGGFATGQVRSTTRVAGSTLGYGDNGSAVTVRVTLAGDADLDGDVDFNDFLSLQTSFGTAGTRFDQGNFNYDGATDFNDFLALQTNFGQSIGADTAVFTDAQYAQVMAITSANAVPEPASLALLGLGAAGLIGRRRRTA